MNAVQKSLNSLERFFAFTFNQCIFSFFARIMPPFGQSGRILRSVPGFDQLEAAFFYQLLIHARWTEKIHTH